MSLSRIQRLRLAAVQEDCRDQLDIIGHTLTLRISRERGPEAAQEMIRLTNLRKDCQYISQQVSRLLLELEEAQSFSFLQQAAKEEEQKERAENMRSEAQREMEQRKQAHQQQQEEFQQKTEKLQDMEVLITGLKQQLNEESAKIVNVKNIVERTQKETSQTEELLRDQLELLQKQLNEEKRVHVESMKFLQNRHEEVLQQQQHWEQLTKQMLQEKEHQLNSLGCKRTVNNDRVTEMKRKFSEMQQVVIEGRKEQEKLQQQQEEARIATKLQAWWRGCMVRRGLGSFRKTEETKKGKKKKEGKKTKK